MWTPLPAQIDSHVAAADTWLFRFFFSLSQEPAHSPMARLRPRNYG